MRQIARVRDLACRMAQKSPFDILFGDTHAIVRYADQCRAAIPDLNRYRRRSGINGIFHQLLDHGGRPFHDLACGDLVDRIL